VNAASAALRQWWPGASWVNLVGIDGYYYRSSDTFSSVFSRTIAQIRTFSNAPADHRAR
jgi:beta-mannanase